MKVTKTPKATIDRRIADPWRKDVGNDIHDLKGAVSTLQAEMTANTDTTNKIEARTNEMYEILTTFKGGMKVLGYFGSVAKWVGIIAGSITAVLGALVASDELAKHFPSLTKWFK